MAKKTTSKKTSAELDMMAMVVESIPYAYALFDDKDRLVQFNSTYLKNSALGRKFLSSQPTFEQIIRQMIKRGQIEQAPENAENWVKWHIAQHLKTTAPFEIFIRTGQVLRCSEKHLDNGYISSRYEDITEQKNQDRTVDESEAHLEAARNRLTEAIDGMSEVLVMYDAEDRLVLCNANFRKVHKDFPELSKPGTTISHTIRTLVKGGYFGKLAHPKTFTKDRIAMAKKTGVREVELPGGKHERAITTKTRDGGMVIVWSDISQFKKISNDLARREKHLRGILDTVPDAIITINEKGIIDTFNPAAERMFGYQARDVIGKNIKKLMPQPYRREHDGYLLEFLKTGNARVIGIGSEVIGRRKDGSTFAMDLSVSEGDHLGEKMFIGVADDITERKLAEQALRRSEQDLRSILNNLRDGFFRVDMGGFITMASPSATKLTGYSIKQLIGKKISDIFIDPGEQKGFFAALRENAGNATEYEVQIHQKNGKQIWGGINSRLIFDDQGQPVGIEGIARDVTQRKTAEAALILSEERLALAMEASREGLWDWNMETNAVNISARMEQMLAIKDKSKVSAKTLQKLVHDDDVEHFRAALVAHLKENTAAFECEFRYYDKNKNIGWMRNRGIALRNPDGRAYRMIGSIDDITRRKQDEEALRDALEQAEIANRTKTDFLANISHELRTPLNAIIGFSDLINSEIFGPIGVEKYKDYTQTIAESGHHLLDIINDILDIARIEVGKLDFRPEPVDLENVIQSCLRLIAERAEKGGLSLRRNVQGGLPTVNADPRRLKQIFLNLLTNAVKFTPRGGTVTLRARMTKAGTLAISISDSGIGMKSDDIPKVMTPFVQVDSKLSRAYEGTGLGLPLTKLFVELHGGDMSIKSSPGTGTTVTVYLPNSILLN